MMQKSLVVLIVAMIQLVSNAAYVTLLKFSLFFTVLHLLQQQKQHVWHHLQVAVVASRGGRKRSAQQWPPQACKEFNI